MNLETDVLIAGLGPVGAALAALLGKWGVSAIAAEREKEVYRLPRAAHFDHEIMRLFQQLGIAAEIRDSVRVLPAYEFRNASGEKLLRFDLTASRTPSGWARSYTFHQPAMEIALRRRLAEFPQIKTLTGHTLTGISANDPNGVTVTVSAPDGREYSVRARFLVGADGGASLVRRLAGIEVFDYGFEESWIVVDTIVKDESGLPSYGLQICDPARPTTVMPMSPGRRRWEFMLLPGESAEEMLADANIAKLLATQVRPNQAEVVRKAVYTFHGLVARRWRDGSILLAGDAAHQMPPFMGQGMCSGLRDAANLAWKLALVCKEQADPALLDTYQIEREPHVRFIIERAIEMGRIICTLDPNAARIRDDQMIGRDSASPSAVPPDLPPISGGFVSTTAMAGTLFPQSHARLRDGRQGRLDDLMGHEFWLVSKGSIETESMPHLKVVQIGADLVDDGTVEEWLRRAGAEAALVRPDRYVYGTGAARELLSSLRNLILKAPASDLAASRLKVAKP
ncbi:MAG TPA: bifunctional 3-(3-hydroxy-phenyl)propionate/3-hydroxycinnamic acid hydroxylase [Candidatus Binataceae bacterium]|nr:bifunctional 3-(3-hydroxy-phenyl)propionate/3-hydroxycinnamic acid hydroxylase [Candidatus Binataceae bacterium]